MRVNASSPRGGALAVKERRDDSQAQLRRISTLFAQAESEDGPAPQPGYVPDGTRGGSARARGPVLQIPRLSFVALAFATQRLALDIRSGAMRLRESAAALALCVAVAGGASTLSRPSMGAPPPPGTLGELTLEL